MRKSKKRIRGIKGKRVRKNKNFGGRDPERSDRRRNGGRHNSGRNTDSNGNFRLSADRSVSGCRGTRNKALPSDRARNGYRESQNRKNSDWKESRNNKHKAVCEQCGAEFELPFKPRANKPVYCEDCFDSGKNKGPKKINSGSNRELQEINKKLDMIMKALNLD